MESSINEDSSEDAAVASPEPDRLHRKRRLSKKEQKALKKQRQKTNPVSESESTKQQSIVPNASDVAPSKVLEKQKEQVSEEQENYLESYVPVPLLTSLETPSSPSTLGKWFPKAKAIKSSVDRTGFKEGAVLQSSLVLFYQYVVPQWSTKRVDELTAYLSRIAHLRGIGGRIRIAPEGVNATVSCAGIASARAIRHFTLDLQQFDPKAFAKTDFKFVDQLQIDRHFKEVKLLPVQELVFYGISSKEAPLDKGGIHLEPNEYHEMLKQENAVVIDVRNHYEAAIGRFDGQTKPKESHDKDGAEGSLGGKGGAEYLDPMMRKSTDFPSWLEKPETKKKLEGKTVLMYCTGGVRCERASSYLKTKMGNDVKGVYQLQGGIEKYLKEFPDGGHWQGKNYVFDKREAIGINNMEGDGGVVWKKQKAKMVKNDVDTVCCVCASPWDRYIGKKKCYTCGVPVLMCDSCMSKKPDKVVGKELSVRCPLCVSENITVPASQVEYTENGVKGRVNTGPSLDSKFNNGEESQAVPQHGKAATSVLKWGGGHAKQKKVMRHIKKKVCQFGKDCARKDCVFLHPDGQFSNSKHV